MESPGGPKSRTAILLASQTFTDPATSVAGNQQWFLLEPTKRGYELSPKLKAQTWNISGGFVLKGRLRFRCRFTRIWPLFHPITCPRSTLRIPHVELPGGKGPPHPHPHPHPPICLFPISAPPPIPTPTPLPFPPPSSAKGPESSRALSG